MSLAAIAHTRLEKAAVDNGFDRQLPADGAWLAFASTQAPTRLWLTVDDQRLLAALSQRNVSRMLEEEAKAAKAILPRGAFTVFALPDLPGLHRFLRRAFQLSKSLPDELLVVFQRKTAALPRSTEAERLVIQRVGQDLFRAGLLDYWNGRCAITGLAVPELLRASHIKPWADCTDDAERLDVFNGLLLAPHLDAVFDKGYMMVEDDGAIVISEALASADRGLLGLSHPMRVERLADAHRRYLPWHRGRVFKR